MKFLKLRADCQERDKLDQINNEAFPPSERMSMDAIFTFAEQENMDVLGLYEEKLVGFLVLLKNDVCGYVYFLAIAPEFRSRGYGSKALALLLASYPELQIVLDFEELDSNAENAAQRERRRAFYLRNGFHETGRYTVLNGERFEVVCGDSTLNADAFQEILEVIHAHIPEFQNVLL